MLQLGHGKRNFAKRVQYLCEEEFVDEALRDELLWLWDARAGVHVYEVTELELDTYDIADSNRATRTMRALMESLNTAFIAREFDVIEA